MKYLFLDTNVLLHYTDFEQIDWKNIFHDDITIVLSPKTIEEIDTIKDRDSNAKKKRKAKAINTKINDYLLEEKKGRFNVISCLDPQDSLFERFSLNKSVNDDWFLLAAMRFAEENGKDAIIITADSGPLIKAKRLGLMYHKLEDKYFQTDEPSNEDKEIERLKKELNQYKNRQAKPEILFDNGGNILRVSKPKIQDIDAVIQTKLGQEKQKYPYNITYETEDYLSGAMNNTIASIWGRPNAETVQQYNSDIDEYLKEYEEYIKLQIEYGIMSTYLYKIQFRVSNIGTCPTGDMHFLLEFPSEVKLYNNSALKKKHLNPPVPPRLGSPRKFEKMLQAHKDFSTNFVGGGVIDNRQKNYYWDLTRQAKHKYEISGAPLSHNLSRNLNLEDLYIDLRYGNSFQVKYVIIDTTLIEPVEGVLHVVFE